MATLSFLKASEVTFDFYMLTGRLAWSREEALAHVLAVEMVDLPVAPSLANMEEEFGSTSPGRLHGHRRPLHVELCTVLCSFCQTFKAGCMV